MTASGQTVRDARRRIEARRGLPWLVLLLAVLVAGGVLLLTRGGDDDRPVFASRDPTIPSPSTPDGEGLMGDRRRMRPIVDDRHPDEAQPYVVALVGPGSAVLDYASIVLDRDAEPVRIRQTGTSDIGGRDLRRSVSWQGWVAREPADYGTKETFSDLRWRSAGEDGVVVRPGETVRLRTRYDVPRSTDRICTTEVFSGGGEWEAHSAGDEDDEPGLDPDWTTLRIRSADDEARAITVRTGANGLLGFRIGRAGCRPGSVSGLGGDVDDD